MTTILNVDQAKGLVAEALVASNTSLPNAASVAAALVNAELWGQVGHGLRRTVAYAAQARAGKVDGHAVPHAEQPRPGLLNVDAANGFAYPALDLVIDRLPNMAVSQGIAMAGIRRSHHCGVTGLVVDGLARKGLVAMMFANAPAAMAPWGGNRALFGTNPVAFAAPVDGADPLVIDLSLSKVARGKIMAANQKGEPIPEGWALDKDGQPTTDAKAGLEGFMVPAGDAKGVALALMVEMLCAGITGANYSFEASSFFDAAGDPPGVGQSIIAIDPSAFGPHIGERMTSLVMAMADTKGARVPGARRHGLAKDIEANGIMVDEALMADIQAISA
ncbi:MAG: Ldh family oxidoreductase [Pseudomonadota bacterium]